MNADCTAAEVVRESDEASETVVPKMSTENGILYLYTREINDDIPERAMARYFTAVDFITSETLYNVFTLSGKNRNNSYGPITI